MRSIPACSLFLALTTGCSQDDWWFEPYERTIDPVPIAANATYIEVSGFLDLKRNADWWTCEIEPFDRAVLDDDLAYISSLTSIVGDVDIVDIDCTVDPADFAGHDKNVEATLDVSYDVIDLVYGDARVTFDLFFSFNRRDGTSGFTRVDHPRVDID